MRGAARDDSAAAERFLGIMESEALRMTRLINELLVLSKVETEEHIRPEDSIDLRPVLNQVAATMVVRAKERDIVIALNLPEDLPLITGNPDELTQVFQNLISNAVNYGSAKTPIRVAVAARVPVPGTENSGVSVSVMNSGEGIPQRTPHALQNASTTSIRAGPEAWGHRVGPCHRQTHCHPSPGLSGHSKPAW